MSLLGHKSIYLSILMKQKKTSPTIVDNQKSLYIDKTRYGLISLIADPCLRLGGKILQ